MAAQHSTVLTGFASTVLRPVNRNALSNQGTMKVIGQIRRERLQMLQEETGLSLADMSVKLGRSRRDATLSQVANAAPNTRTGRPRQMGDDQARALEAAFEKPTGWFDRDPDFDELQRQFAASKVVEMPIITWPFAAIDYQGFMQLDANQRQRVDDFMAGIVATVDSHQATGGARAAK